MAGSAEALATSCTYRGPNDLMLPRGDRPLPGLAAPGGHGPLPQLALRHRERPGRETVVMEAGALPGQPGQQPHLVVAGQFQAPVPALAGAEAHQPVPRIRPRRHRAHDPAQARLAQACLAGMPLAGICLVERGHVVEERHPSSPIVLVGIRPQS